MRSYSYTEYLTKIRDMVKEPLPDDALESVITIDEAFSILAREQGRPDDAIRLPGWLKFDELLRGIRMHEFTIFCGPTGVGKTTWLANLAAHLAAAQVPLFIASVEVGSSDFIRKMLSVLTGKNVNGLSTAAMNQLQEEHRIVFKTGMHVFTIYDSRVKHERILADTLVAHETCGTQVGIYDNLNFMTEVTRAQDSILTMDKAVHEFVVFHKKVRMHSFMVMHPKKTEHGRVESEFDIKGSSTAVQEAANVLLFNRLAKDSHAPENAIASYCRELKFAKVRKNGRSVGARIIYSLFGESDRLDEVDLL